jgi:hypothetical protein
MVFDVFSDAKVGEDVNIRRGFQLPTSLVIRTGLCRFEADDEVCEA